MPVAAAARPIPWAMLGTLAKLIGFVLFFVGIIVVIAFVSVPANCLSSQTACSPTGFGEQALNSIIAGKILALLGLAGMGAGAGIKLHWGARPQPGEDSQVWIADHRFNGLLFLVTLLLMFVLLITVNSAPGITGLP